MTDGRQRAQRQLRERACTEAAAGKACAEAARRKACVETAGKKACVEAARERRENCERQRGSVRRSSWRPN